MSATFTPNLSDTSRCVSIHWSMPVQCVLPRTHRENWHEAWHPETGNRMRYRRAIGATQELHHGVWRNLKIPAPAPSAEADVERLTARVAELEAAPSRADVIEEVGAWLHLKGEFEAAYKVRYYDIPGEDESPSPAGGRPVTAADVARNGGAR